MNIKVMSNPENRIPFLFLREKVSPLTLILLLGFVVRVGVLVFYPDQHFPDAEGYVTAGRAFFSTGFIPSDFHMPLYIIWGYLLGGGVGLKLADIVFSTLSIWFMYELTIEIFKNRRAALIVALIAAFYPHFLFYSTSRLTETSFTCAVLLGFLLLYRREFLWASFVFALSILIRPTFELFNPILVFLFAYFIHQLTVKEALKKVAVYGLVYGLVMSPWWVHNTLKYGEFVRLSLGDGHVLYSGNNMVNKSGGGVIADGIVDADFSAFDSIDNPVEKSRAKKRAVLKFIKDHPKRFMELSGIKFIRFWRLWPYATEYSQWYLIIVSLLSYGLALLLSLIFTGLYFSSYFRTVLPIYLFTGYLTAVHMVTIGSIRYRFPIEPFLVIFAGFVIQQFLKRVKRAQR